MPTIMPQSELLRKAVMHVDASLKDHPEKSLHTHIDDASMRFNLSPLDAEALRRLFEEKTVASAPAGDEHTGNPGRGF